MADIRIFSAKKIITLNNYISEASHVAVKDGRVLGVGDLSVLDKWGDYDLDDRFQDKVLMPGFVEGHGHMQEGSMWQSPYVGYFDRAGPDGAIHKGFKSIDDVVSYLQRLEAEMDGPDKPLVAWSFDPIYFEGRRMDVADLDKVSTTRPVLVLHASLHITNINTAFVEEMGWSEGATNVVGIQRDAAGKPSGELHGTSSQFAMGWVAQQMLAGGGQKLEWENYGKVCARAGVTTISDLANPLSEKTVDNLHAWSLEPEARMRLVPALWGNTTDDDVGLARLAHASELNTDKLFTGIVKFVVDGSIQGFTGRLRWPGYANGAENGIWNVHPHELPGRVEKYLSQGYQAHIHTNGDEATEVAIAALDQVLRKHNCPDHRTTLQHCQMADEAQFERMKALGICANLFSNHLFYWADEHARLTMGPDRARRMNAAGTAARLGVPFAIHSDVPITPLDPLFTAWCAVNRETASGAIMGPEECISVDAALRAVTVGAAYTLKLDHLVGTIEAGKFADFAVLEDDPLAVDPHDLKDVPVWGTVLGGDVFEGVPG